MLIKNSHMEDYVKQLVLLINLEDDTLEQDGTIVANLILNN